MGNKVGNKMKQANTIKDTVCDNWETTDKHKRNKVGDKQGGRQVGDTVRNAVGDKLGDNLETRWQIKRQTRFQGYGKGRSGRSWETQWQTRLNPAHTCQREERNTTTLEIETQRLPLGTSSKSALSAPYWPHCNQLEYLAFIAQTAPSF